MPTAQAAPPYPISRLDAGEYPEDIPVGIDAGGTKVVLADGIGGPSSVLDLGTGRRTTLAGRATTVSGNGKVVYSIDENGAVTREKVGSGKITTVRKALPSGDWIAQSVDTDFTGRYVVISASNGVFATVSVFLADTVKRTSIDVTKGAGKQVQASGGTVSSDGRYTAFIATKTFGGTNHVYVYDRVTKKTVIATRTPSGQKSNGTSSLSQISADGRSVVFSSNAGDLVPGAPVGAAGLYVRDLRGKTTKLVAESITFGVDPQISANGRRIAYMAPASVAVDGGGTFTDTGLFVWTNGVTVRIDEDTKGGLPNSGARQFTLSSNGRVLVFASTATDLHRSGKSGVFSVRLPAV